MQQLIVRDLSETQKQAFGQLFPALHRAGLVAERGRTALVITVHPQVFRNHPDRPGYQLACSLPTLWNNRGRVGSGLKLNTIQGLQRRLRAAATEEV